MTATELVQAYYAAFNAGDMPAFLDLLADDVVHDINQGACQTGKDAFRSFMDHMNRCYKEQLTDMVIMGSADGTRGAAEFVVNGEYLVRKSQRALRARSRSATARSRASPTTTISTTGSPRSAPDSGWRRRPILRRHSP